LSEPSKRSLAVIASPGGDDFLNQLSSVGLARKEMRLVDQNHPATTEQRGRVQFRYEFCYIQSVAVENDQIGATYIGIEHVRNERLDTLFNEEFIPVQEIN
jgi:hypothetical protein